MSNDCERGHPDSALIDCCLRCGAPVCCAWCCEVDELQQQLAEAQKRLEITEVLAASLHDDLTVPSIQASVDEELWKAQALSKENSDDY